MDSSYLTTYVVSSVNYRQGIIMQSKIFVFLTLIIELTMAAVDNCPKMQYWNGTHCVQCSGCPRGFGVKTLCTSKTDTECHECLPGYDYSNTTGFEECILCDKYSNCFPGNSKQIKACTIFAGPVCDGCEDGNYFDPVVGGCVKCMPPCNILQEEIRSCTTKHNRRCTEKTTTTVTPPGLGDSPTSPADTEIPSTGQGGKVEPEPPALAAKGTRSPSSTPLEKNGLLWGGVALGLVILVIAIAVAIKQKKSSNETRRHAKAKIEGRPLMTPADFGLDDPISSLNIEGRRFITQRLNGKGYDGYFYWQMCAEKLGMRAECDSWKHFENPAEKFLKAYGEKAGSTVRKLVEVLRDPGVELTQFANEVEEKFSPPQDQGENENVGETEV